VTAQRTNTKKPRWPPGKAKLKALIEAAIVDVYDESEQVRASRHRRLTRLSNAHAVESDALNLWRSRIQLSTGFELRTYATPPITSGLNFRGETALFRRMLGVTVPLTYELPRKLPPQMCGCH
jgi:hypothetical protein